MALPRGFSVYFPFSQQSRRMMAIIQFSTMFVCAGIYPVGGSVRFSDISFRILSTLRSGTMPYHIVCRCRQDSVRCPSSVAPVRHRCGSIPRPTSHPIHRCPAPAILQSPVARRCRRCRYSRPRPSGCRGLASVRFL